MDRAPPMAYAPLSWARSPGHERRAAGERGAQEARKFDRRSAAQAVDADKLNALRHSAAESSLPSSSTLLSVDPSLVDLGSICCLGSPRDSRASLSPLCCGGAAADANNRLPLTESVQWVSCTRGRRLAPRRLRLPSSAVGLGLRVGQQRNPLACGEMDAASHFASKSRHGDLAGGDWSNDPSRRAPATMLNRNGGGGAAESVEWKPPDVGADANRAKEAMSGERFGENRHAWDLMGSESVVGSQAASQAGVYDEVKAVGDAQLKAAAAAVAAAPKLVDPFGGAARHAKDSFGDDGEAKRHQPPPPAAAAAADGRGDDFRSGLGPNDAAEWRPPASTAAAASPAHPFGGAPRQQPMDPFGGASRHQGPSVLTGSAAEPFLPSPLSVNEPKPAAVLGIDLNAGSGAAAEWAPKPRAARSSGKKQVSGGGGAAVMALEAAKQASERSLQALVDARNELERRIEGEREKHIQLVALCAQLKERM